MHPYGMLHGHRVSHWSEAALSVEIIGICLNKIVSPLVRDRTPMKCDVPQMRYGLDNRHHRHSRTKASSSEFEAHFARLPRYSITLLFSCREYMQIVQ